METADKNLFEIFSLDKVFFKKYLEDFFKRYTKEEYNEEILNSFIKFNNNKIIDIKDLIDLGDSVNTHLNIYGLRTYNEEDNLGGSFVYRKLNTLISCYHGFWSSLSTLEKESMLQVQIMKLKPFNENNLLISELILFSNLIHQNIPPLIIYNKVEYYKALEDSDGLKLKSLLENETKKEMNYIINFYKEFYKLDKTRDIKEILILKV